MKFHLTWRSANAKTGPIPVSTTGAQSCPDACPLKKPLQKAKSKKGGCYASAGGPLALHWRKVTEEQRGDSLDAFCAKVASLPDGQLWRHNQAGDLPGKGDKIDVTALAKLVKANVGRRGFTYTHKPVVKDKRNRDAVKKSNLKGFTINLSANSPAHADQLAKLAIAPVVTILPEDAPDKLETPSGRKIIVCPAQTHEGISCATCQLCSRSTRSIIIGFKAHGTQARKVSELASK